MKIFLFGYGRMGREIEAEAGKRRHEVVGVFDPDYRRRLDYAALSKSDIAIEFSLPDTAKENMITCFKANKPVVCGTTGWYKQLKSVMEICREFDGTLLYSPNFSLTVNSFFKLNSYLARFMNNMDGYEVSVSEVHHAKKKDAPSGTAVKLAENLAKILFIRNKWVVLEKGSVGLMAENEFPVFYSRQEGVTGIHEVEYKSSIDKISIRHEAFNRKGFAIGTLIASEWVLSKKGIFTMDDLMDDVFQI